MKTVTTAALAALVMLLGVAVATPAEARDNQRRGYDRSHAQRDWRQARPVQRNQGYRSDRRNTRVVHVPRPVVVRQPAVHYPPRPAYARPAWVRGRHYGYAGYAPTYVVHDYAPYGLRHPPRGYHWRRSDAGDFLLVAIATGIIADIILNH